MKKGQKDRILVRFKAPEPTTNIVEVARVRPDNTEETIGKIYPAFVAGEDSIKYISVNNLGEEIFPPTLDFIDIENHFVKYVQELDVRASLDEQNLKVQEFEKRGKTLKRLRQLKVRLQSGFITR